MRGQGVRKPNHPRGKGEEIHDREIAGALQETGGRTQAACWGNWQFGGVLDRLRGLLASEMPHQGQPHPPGGCPPGARGEAGRAALWGPEHREAGWGLVFQSLTFPWKILLRTHPLRHPGASGHRQIPGGVGKAENPELCSPRLGPVPRVGGGSLEEGGSGPADRKPSPLHWGLWTGLSGLRSRGC